MYIIYNITILINYYAKQLFLIDTYYNIYFIINLAQYHYGNVLLQFFKTFTTYRSHAFCYATRGARVESTLLRYPCSVEHAFRCKTLAEENRASSNFCSRRAVQDSCITVHVRPVIHTAPRCMHHGACTVVQEFYDCRRAVHEWNPHCTTVHAPFVRILVGFL